MPLETTQALAARVIEFPESGIRLWQTVVDIKGGKALSVTIDCETGQPLEYAAAIAAEEAALKQRYGKFTTEAWEKLQSKGDNDLMRIGISVRRIPQVDAEIRKIQQELIRIYPGVTFTGHGLILLPPEGKTREEYRQMGAAWGALKQEHIYDPALGPLVEFIEGNGYETITSTNHPIFTAIVPKWLVLELAKREDVLDIRDFTVETPEPALSEATSE